MIRDFERLDIGDGTTVLVRCSFSCVVVVLMFYLVSCGHLEL